MTQLLASKQSNKQTQLTCMRIFTIFV